MKKNIIIAAVLISAGFLFLSLITAGSHLFRRALENFPRMTMAEQQPAADHQGHGHAQMPQETQAHAQEDDASDEPMTVEITLEKQQLFGIKITEVSVRRFQKTIRTVGRLDYDERKLYTINTKFEGWIEKLYVDYTGRYVNKGEPLADIYSPELFATQQEFLSLLNWKSNISKNQQNPELKNMLTRDADSIIEAAQQRLHLWDISEEQINTIKEAGKPLRTLTIYSPANGYVTDKMAIQGMRVMPGEMLFTIADLSSLWVLADIYEYELPVVKPGQKAIISLSYFPGKEFHSTIDYVYPSISRITRTATVRFEIPNHNNELKPQMFTNIEIKIDLGQKLSIPDDAFIDTGKRQIVYVDKGEGFFEPREVMLGMRGDGLREVLGGLREGEKIASSATFLIDSEAQLTGVKPLGGHKH